MRSIVRRDNGATYEEFLEELAKQSGLESRAGKTWRESTGSARKDSNEEWKSPVYPGRQGRTTADFAAKRVHVEQDALNARITRIFCHHLRSSSGNSTLSPDTAQR